METKRKFFTVVTNTWKEISIDESELPKAMWAFLKDTGAVFKTGACQKIMSITPDKVKSIGWNEGYKPIPEEMKYIQEEFGRSFENLIVETKTLVHGSRTLEELQNKYTQSRLLLAS